nr:MAG TPA: hypothetical protein [Caudoviricetes sp.]
MLSNVINCGWHLENYCFLHRKWSNSVCFFQCYC